jgi:hypothetical protein
MKRALVVLASVAFVSGCESSSGGTDATVTDTPAEVADVVETTPEVVPDTAPETVKPDTPVVDVAETVNDTATKEEVTVGCPATAFAGPTCAEMAACAFQCDDAAYETQCLAQGETAAKDAYTALKDCLATAACKDFFKGEEFPACAVTGCADKLDACFAGALKCKDIWTCRKACDAENPGCALACYGMATPDQQDVWVAYEHCIFQVDCTQDPANLQANGWPTPECEAYAAGHNCPNQRQACVPPT